MKRITCLVLVSGMLVLLAGCGKGSAAQVPVEPPKEVAPPREFVPANAPIIIRSSGTQEPDVMKKVEQAIRIDKSGKPGEPIMIQLDKNGNTPIGDFKGKFEIRTEEGALPEIITKPDATPPTAPAIEKSSPTSDSGRRFKTPRMPDGLPSWFTEKDRDGDGQIGMHEWPRRDMDEFMKLDRNGDGIITIEEAMRTVKKATVVASTGSALAPSTTTTSSSTTTSSAGAGGPGVVAFGGGGDMTEMMFKRYDKNNDGKIDAEEMKETQRLKYSWQQHDANKDGMIDKTEFAAYMKESTRGGFGGGGAGGTGGSTGGFGMTFGNGGSGFGGGGSDRNRGGFGGGGPGSGGPGNSGRDRGNWMNTSPDDRAKGMITTWDKNNDGKVSQDEMPSYFRERFSEWDANKDGFVDASELKVGFEKMSQAGGFGNRGRRDR